MTPEQIFSQFLKPNQRILHLGGNAELKELAKAHEYTHLTVDQLDDYSNIPPQAYDYVIMSDILELVNDPIELLKHVKDLAKTTIVYEFKYDEMDDPVDPVWSKIWQKIGLEYILTREFDYVNSIFLGHATIHTCEMPYTETDKEHPDAIR